MDNAHWLIDAIYNKDGYLTYQDEEYGEQEVHDEDLQWAFDNLIILYEELHGEHPAIKGDEEE